MRCYLALALLLTPAFANDVWVDATSGSNGNGGTSPVDAWQTLTYALDQLGPGPCTVHVLPGVYDTALGESFPLCPEGGQELVGEGGAGVTRIDGVSGAAVVESNHCTLQGLTLTGGDQGVLFVNSMQFSPVGTVVGCVVRDCGAGIRYEVLDADTFGFLTVEDVEVHGCTSYAVDIWNRDDLPIIFVDLIRSTFRDCTLAGLRVFQQYDTATVVDAVDCTFTQLGRGVYVESPASGTSAAINMNRCTITESVEGLRSDADPGAHFDLNDCLIADHLQNGIVMNSTEFGRVELDGCTVANNGHAGYRWTACPPVSDVLERTILFGNGDDVQLPAGAVVQVEDCNVGDGDFAGSNGNVSVDPLFRAPDRGDYRLGFGTECVDAAPGVTGTDVRGAARGNDGNLDLVLAADMGAYELRTLSAPDTIGIGEKLNFELHGEPGDFLTLYLARTDQLPVPDPTPFGLRWLPQSQLELIGMHKVLSPHALVHTVYVPNAPGLIGMAFSFQVLARSSAAPAGAAWGDAHTVVFTP
ncbi:MAG: DUF1565 domain-containing protein [bacterium]|nr:DUF1565 domain-containing protein [bacterium]